MKLFPNSMAHIIMPIMIIKSEIDNEIEQILHKNFVITLSDFQTLLPIALLTKCTQKDIALFNLVSEASVSRKIKHLIDNGLVVRKEDKRDGRKAVLQLTTKGRLLVMKIQARVIKKMEQIFKSLSKKARGQLSDGLQEMMHLQIACSPRKETLESSKNPVLQNLLRKKTSDHE